MNILDLIIKKLSLKHRIAHLHIMLFLQEVGLEEELAEVLEEDSEAVMMITMEVVVEDMAVTLVVA